MLASGVKLVWGGVRQCVCFSPAGFSARASEWLPPFFQLAPYVQLAPYAALFAVVPGAMRLEQSLDYVMCDERVVRKQHMPSGLEIAAIRPGVSGVGRLATRSVQKGAIWLGCMHRQCMDRSVKGAGC